MKIEGPSTLVGGGQWWRISGHSLQNERQFFGMSYNEEKWQNVLRVSLDCGSNITIFWLLLQSMF